MNNSDYDANVNLYGFDNNVKESFLVKSDEETVIYEIGIKDFLCAPVDSFGITTVGDSLELTIDIYDGNNWMEDNDGSSKKLKIKKCLFVFNNDDLE